MDILKKSLIGSAECDCGQMHKARLNLFDGGLVNSLKKIRPEGTHILLVGGDGDLSQFLSKIYRVSSFLDWEKNYKQNPNLVLDIRLCVGVGVDALLAKRLAHSLKIPCVILDGADFCPFIFDLTGGFVQIKRTANPFIIPTKPLSDDNIAINFAHAALGLLGLFEWTIGQVQPCPHIFDSVQNALVSMLKTADLTRLSRSNSLRESVFDCNLRLNIASNLIGHPALLQNGAIQAAAALMQLINHESGGTDGAWLSFNRSKLSIWSLGLMLAPTVARCYAAFLSSQINFCPPPDLPLRVLALNEFLGIKQANSLNLIPPLKQKNWMEKREYFLKTNQSDLIKKINNLAFLLEKAHSIYLRLLPDGGFSQKNLFSALETSLSLGLGPDIFSADTLLKFMRDKGVLDKYIL
ncbi:MAG: hypothetical protein FWD86_02425 [Firmicutes bacterium]|nr:hypothetical protein [Bacillota bacterium]